MSTLLSDLEIIDTQKIAITNFAVAVLAKVGESAKQENAPVHEGNKEVDQWVRLSDVEDVINKCLQKLQKE